MLLVKRNRLIIFDHQQHLYPRDQTFFFTNNKKIYCWRKYPLEPHLLINFSPGARDFDRLPTETWHQLPAGHLHRGWGMAGVAGLVQALKKASHGFLYGTLG